MSSVAVIGGGITGLAAAHALIKQRPGTEVTLIERDSRLGGKILTEHQEGVTYEAGPDAFVARDPAILELCKDLGLSDDLIAPQVFGAYIWSRGEMKSLPADWAFGLPPTVASLLRSDLLSIEGKLRALWDVVGARKVREEDVSVGALVRSHFGGQLLESVVDPLLAGSRAGTADDISLAAAMPPLDSVARSSASITRGLARARSEGKLPSGPPPFLGISGGMEHLVDRLRSSLAGITLLTGSAAASVEPISSGGYTIGLEDGTSVTASGAVVATPAYNAAQLLEVLAPEAARQMYRIQYASSAVAVLVYTGGHDKIPGGSGFLVPSRDHKLLSACTWFSKKWPVPGDDRLVLRCFVGRSGRDTFLALEDDHLIALMNEEVRAALALEDDLMASRLYRWERALPQYRVGHLGLVERIETALGEHPRIEVAGASYRGSGLPDCVRQGQEAATRVLAAVGARAD